MRPFARSQCHRCRHNTHIISAKGSVFLKCSAHAQKYQPQPQIRCPLFAPLPLVQLVDSQLAWVAPPLEAPITLRIAAGACLLGTLPATPAKAMPGGGFMQVEGGMQWQATPQRGPTLGWWIGGQLRLPSIGAEVELIPLGR